MNIIKEILTDWKHWVGWVLTTLVILGVFYYLGVTNLYTPFYHALILFLIIVVIDIIKHIIKLQ